jgi:hypothetical protein
MRFGVMAVGLALSVPQIGQAETWRFVWEGSGGYLMTGALAFDSAGADGLVTEGDADCFVIEGSRNGLPIGRWALGMLTIDTTWVLSFDPAAGAFVVYGDNAWMPQAWNMDGYGTDCGPEGFGFNIGGAAQDLCLKGELLYESQVDAVRPFPAERDDAFVFPPDACIGPELIGLAPQLFGGTGGGGG